MKIECKLEVNVRKLTTVEKYNVPNTQRSNEPVVSNPVVGDTIGM